MLTEISDEYDAKIGNIRLALDQQIGQKGPSDQETVDARQLTESLKTEIQTQKDLIECLEKDNNFKTEQLEIYLKDSEDKSTKIYELRIKVMDRDSQIQIVQGELDSTKQVLTETQNQKDLADKLLEESKKQIRYLTEEISGSSHVKASFVKERVNDNLTELYEKLRVENTSLKLQLA